MVRNIYNIETVDALIMNKASSYKETVAAWISSTFRRWLLANAPAKPVMDERELNSPTAIMLEVANLGFRETLATKVKLVNLASESEWVQRAIADRDNLVCIDVDEIEWSIYEHWFDYLETLPVDKSLRQTVEHVIEAVTRWDKQLARQKLISSLSDGVEIVEHEVFANHAEPLMLVKLVSESAYKNEGAIMSHCVGTSGYWGRKDTQVFSLRHAEAAKPLATIEIRKSWGGEFYVQQVKAAFNKQPEPYVTEALNAYFAAVKIALVSPKDSYDCEPTPDDYDEELNAAEMRDVDGDDWTVNPQTNRKKYSKKGKVSIPELYPRTPTHFSERGQHDQDQ